jgi:EmrB/QacA subfamily drug resistance transporter
MVYAVDVYTVYQRWTLALAGLTTFMLVLDLTVVTVALGSIRNDLHAGLGALQWLVDAYAVSLAVLLLAAATLGDRAGRRRVFLAGVAVFTLASLACGLAPAPAALDLARAVQGMGAAALLGTGAPLLAAAFPDPRGRDRVLAVYAAVAGSAVAAGPLIGGALTAGFGWRAVFLVNVPLGAFAFVAGAGRLVDTRDADPRGSDWTGTALLSGGLLALTIVLLRGQTLGWSSGRTLGLFALAVLLLGAFVDTQRRAPSPTIDLALFRRIDYAANALVAFLVQGGVVGALVYLSLYLQTALGLSPLATGLRFLAFSVVALATPLLLIAVGRRIPPYAVVVASAALAAAGLALMARIGPGDRWTILLPGLLVAGAGISLNNTVVNQVALAAVPAGRAGMASGTVNALKQVGLAVGVAVLGAVQQAGGDLRAVLAVAAGIVAVAAIVAAAGWRLSVT